MKAVQGERGREARAWLRGLARTARSNIAFILLITIGLLASLFSDVFLTPQNLINILSAIAVIGIISLGQTMLIISGNFDMSVASVLGFAGIVAVPPPTLRVAAEHPSRPPRRCRCRRRQRDHRDARQGQPISCDVGDAVTRLCHCPD